MSGQRGEVLLLGSEPAAFSAALGLVESGLSVLHLYEHPFGLHGASRDIGFAYPELGEPWERLEHALGRDCALQFHHWSKHGIESLHRLLEPTVLRGSRLSLARTENEGDLLSKDAVKRGGEPVGDEVRLMSGGAASNYAPVDGAHLAAFETHALTFVPVRVCEVLEERLAEFHNYRAHRLSSELYQSLTLSVGPDRVCAQAGENQARGDLCLLATGLETRRLLGKFHDILLPLKGMAFRTEPLRERARSSVVGLTAGWGSERYRFDSEYRLLGCGVDPGQDFSSEESSVNEKSLRALLDRAAQLFTDFDGGEETLLRWAVAFTATCDGLPLLGPLPGEPRVQLCTGFGASAWSRGWEAGRQLAIAIAADENEKGTATLIARCSPRRFIRSK